MIIFHVFLTEITIVDSYDFKSDSDIKNFKSLAVGSQQTSMNDKVYAVPIVSIEEVRTLQGKIAWKAASRQHARGVACGSGLDDDLCLLLWQNQI